MPAEPGSSSSAPTTAPMSEALPQPPVAGPALSGSDQGASSQAASGPRIIQAELDGPVTLPPPEPYRPDANDSKDKLDVALDTLKGDIIDKSKQIADE